MVHEEIKERIVRESRPLYITCDICGARVDPSNYFRFNTQHYDWGNDSIDSLEKFDACSPECVIKFASKYLEDAYKDKYNTREIKIEHMRGLHN